MKPINQPYERRRPADCQRFRLRLPNWLIIAAFIAACSLPLAVLVWWVG